MHTGDALSSLKVSFKRQFWASMYTATACQHTHTHPHTHSVTQICAHIYTRIYMCIYYTHIQERSLLTVPLRGDLEQVCTLLQLVNTHTHTHTLTHTYALCHPNMYTCIYTYICIYLYTYICIYYTHLGDTLIVNGASKRRFGASVWTAAACQQAQHSFYGFR